MKIPCLNGDAEAIIASLTQEVRQLEAARRVLDTQPVSSGVAALDHLLPEKGWQRGSLVEWLSSGPGGGAGTLSMLAAREILLEGGAIVVADRAGRFFPPAAAAWGIDLAQLIVLRAKSQQDELWALEQALCCEGVAVVWAPLEKVSALSFRRLQLAAETGGGIGLFLRSSRVRGRPTWSDLQLAVRPQSSQHGRRLNVELVRSRNSASGGQIDLELDELTGVVREVERNDESHLVSLATQLAHPTSPRHSARA